jgi:hypothetical protein
MLRALLLRFSVVVFEATPSGEIAAITVPSGMDTGWTDWTSVSVVFPRALAVTSEVKPPVFRVTFTAKAVGAQAVRRISRAKIELQRQLEIERT